MAGDIEGVRYRAFLSYSHRDADFARRLHRRLETYAVPRRLVGQASPRGPVPARLSPIFRDREELPAADDLSAEVRAALAASGALIVVCSPVAAASPWVAREIETFRALHPDRPILAALARGEPEAAFPAPLRQSRDAELIEPLAADFRAGHDGGGLGLLKIVAGVIGLRLDELIQRDAQRRLRAVTAVTVGALVVVVAMGLLTLIAFDARAEADRRRADAEGLVEFMLTDLRTKLKGVGRLDVMAAVNERALQHYGDQDLKRLSADELLRRAAVLHARSEDDLADGAFSLADRELDEAIRSTKTLMDDKPDDPERVFAYAQSVAWQAIANFQQGRQGEAKAGFDHYRTLADRMLVLAPGAAKYLRELAFAEGDLCTLALARPVNAAAALEHCQSSLNTMEKVARAPGSEVGIDADLVNRHAWLSDAYWAVGDRQRCREQRLLQESILNRLIAADPKNMDLQDSWLALQRSLAWFEAASGDPAAARARLVAAIAVADRMVSFDPANSSWSTKRSAMASDIAKLQPQKGRSIEQ